MTTRIFKCLGCTEKTRLLLLHDLTGKKTNDNYVNGVQGRCFMISWARNHKIDAFRVCKYIAPCSQG